MKRIVVFGGLITTSALLLSLFSGAAQAAEVQPAEVQPTGVTSNKDGDGDFWSFCFQPKVIEMENGNKSGGDIATEPNCSRDTIIIRGRDR